MEGVIVKGIGGFYYVKSNDVVYECKARGIFRKEGITPCVGDKVTIELISEKDAIIQAIRPRKNIFTRPPIANVDSFVIVMAAKFPAPNVSLLDKLLVMGELNSTDCVVCINKTDLVKEEDLTIFNEIYSPIYPVVFTSGLTGEGTDTLIMHIKGKAAAIAGPSGVGKSTLINCLEDKKLSKTGDISKKSRRGKHTTRHVELFETKDKGMLFDTPGFTSFNILEAQERDLAYFYPEIIPFNSKCRYDNCRHLTEPGCLVRKAVEKGEIHRSRYESYRSQMNEIREKRKYR